MKDDLYHRGYKEIRGDDPISIDAKIGEKVTIGFNVVIDPDCEIGENVFIGNNTMIRSGVKIGKDSIIGHLVVIESNTVIGKRVTIQSQCHVTKNAIIEDQCFFGPMAMLINTRNISHGRGFEPELAGPKIRFGCRIGSGSIILPGIEIGENSTIGAGAVVTDSVPATQIWFGIPARFKGITPKRERLQNEQKNEQI
jgi:acetyltransferase-like isoleucine patch superfamily enzyme